MLCILKDFYTSVSITINKVKFGTGQSDWVLRGRKRRFTSQELSCLQWCTFPHSQPALLPAIAAGSRESFSILTTPHCCGSWFWFFAHNPKMSHLHKPPEKGPVKSSKEYFFFLSFFHLCLWCSNLMLSLCFWDAENLVWGCIASKLSVVFGEHRLPGTATGLLWQDLQGWGRWAGLFMWTSRYLYFPGHQNPEK